MKEYIDAILWVTPYALVMAFVINVICMAYFDRAAFNRLFGNSPNNGNCNNPPNEKAQQHPSHISTDATNNTDSNTDTDTNINNNHRKVL